MGLCGRLQKQRHLLEACELGECVGTNDMWLGTLPCCCLDWMVGLRCGIHLTQSELFIWLWQVAVASVFQVCFPRGGSSTGGLALHNATAHLPARLSDKTGGLL